jgi:hypothetical protein
VKLGGFTGKPSGCEQTANRLYGRLTTVELGKKWVCAFRAIVEAPGRTDLRKNERDLATEFKLRNLEPPYDQVEEDKDRLIAEIMAQLEVLRTSLPQDFEALRTTALIGASVREHAAVKLLDKSVVFLPGAAQQMLASMRYKSSSSKGSPRRHH